MGLRNSRSNRALPSRNSGRSDVDDVLPPPTKMHRTWKDMVTPAHHLRNAFPSIVKPIFEMFPTEKMSNARGL
uniref:RNA-directed DNA polymerase n=1 Tax=Steinernema glaseri TaxID=37863 RepID=A0A1I7ZB08_9BILA